MKDLKPIEVVVAKNLDQWVTAYLKDEVTLDQVIVNNSLSDDPLTDVDAWKRLSIRVLERLHNLTK